MLVNEGVEVIVDEGVGVAAAMVIIALFIGAPLN